jgi:hemolysin III
VDPIEVRPALRGHLHAAAGLVSIPAGALLIASSEGAAARVAASIYVASLLLLFGTSSLYHRCRWPRLRPLLRRLDHAMIYVLIAGTYTPVCLLALPRAWGIPVLAIVVSGAAAGIAIKLTAFRSASRYANALYPVLGWVVAPAGPAMARFVTPMELGLLVLGGLAYTIGFPVLLLRRPNPWPSTFGYHAVWHTFTVVAAVLHFAVVASLVS